MNGRSPSRAHHVFRARRELEDHFVDRDALAGVRDDPLDDAVVRGDDDVFHLHRLDHGKPLARAHRLAGLHRDLDEQARASATAGSARDPAAA